MRHGRQGVDTTVSKELGLLKHPVHDRLEDGWCIGDPKGKHPELVVPKRRPKSRLWSRRQTPWSEYLQCFNFTWEYRPGRTNVADPLSRNPSNRPVPSLLLHALHAQLNVSTRARTAPVREAAKAAAPGPALHSPAALPNPNLPVTPSVPTVTPVTPSVPPSPASFVDTVAEDMAAEVAAQPVLGLHAEHVQDYELDPWFANADNRQNLRLLDGLYRYMVGRRPHCGATCEVSSLCPHLGLS